MKCTLVRDPYPYAVGCRDQSDQDGRKDRLLTVHGNCSLHGLSGHKVYHGPRREERTHILQQFEDDVPIQGISDTSEQRKETLTLNVLEYKQTVRRHDLQ